MLDHVFTDAISALRDAFETALLERHAFEEHLQSDVLTGDLTWETSYGLPGEGLPPRVEAHITFTWPTWSQTAYRRWYLDGELDESPGIEMEIILRVQRLVVPPEPATVLAVLPAHSPLIGAEGLERTGPTVETAYAADDFTDRSHAIEVSYEGIYVLNEETLADGSSSTLDDHFAAMGAWISSMLIRLGDLKLEYLPPDDEDEES